MSSGAKADSTTWPSGSWTRMIVLAKDCGGGAET